MKYRPPLGCQWLLDNSQRIRSKNSGLLLLTAKMIGQAIQKPSDDDFYMDGVDVNNICPSSFSCSNSRWQWMMLQNQFCISVRNRIWSLQGSSFSLGEDHWLSAGDFGWHGSWEGSECNRCFFPIRLQYWSDWGETLVIAVSLAG